MPSYDQLRTFGSGGFRPSIREGGGGGEGVYKIENENTLFARISHFYEGTYCVPGSTWRWGGGGGGGGGVGGGVGGGGVPLPPSPLNPPLQHR